MVIMGDVLPCFGGFEEKLRKLFWHLVIICMDVTAWVIRFDILQSSYRPVLFCTAQQIIKLTVALADRPTTPNETCS